MQPLTDEGGVEDLNMSYAKCFAIPFVSLLLATACVSVDSSGAEIPKEDPYENRKNVDPNELVGDRIAAVVEALPLQRGQKLLHAMQYLIAKKQLAVEPIVKALEGSDARTRANFLYVLGWINGAESRQALVDNLNYPDVAVRFEAAAGLLQHGDAGGTPHMIDLLESEDRQVRFKAIESLKASTGKEFGYVFAADGEARVLAVQKWRDWWRSEKSRLMVRPANEPPEVPTSERVANYR